MQHSKTYTVLKAPPDRNLQQKQPTLEIEDKNFDNLFNKALHLLKQASISKDDIQILIRACALVDEKFKENALIKLLEATL